MSRKINSAWWNEIIATWKRDQDGMEFVLWRNGQARFRHGPEDKFLPGSEDLGMDTAAKWAENHNFKRI